MILLIFSFLLKTNPSSLRLHMALKPRKEVEVPCGFCKLALTRLMYVGHTAPSTGVYLMNFGGRELSVRTLCNNFVSFYCNILYDGCIEVQSRVYTAAHSNATICQYICSVPSCLNYVNVLKLSSVCFGNI